MTQGYRVGFQCEIFHTDQRKWLKLTAICGIMLGKIEEGEGDLTRRTAPMTQLYTLRTTPTPGEWVVKKFDGDYNCVAEYTVTRDTCSGPDGHRPKCKHREMLRMALLAKQIDTGGFLDWDTRMWRQPLVNPGPIADDLTMDNTIPSEPPTLGLSESEVMAQKLAPAHESEASALVHVSDAGMIRDTMETASALTAAVPPPARAVNAPAGEAEVQRANPAGATKPAFRLLKVKI